MTLERASCILLPTLMFGVLIATIASLFDEVATAFGKLEMRRRVEDHATYGFLQLFWGTVLFGGIAVLREGSFVFVWASLPIMLPLAVLEVVQAHVTVRAISRATRSAFGFIRILTVPLLLGADLALGYTLSPWQFVGIAVLIGTLIVLYKNHGIDRRGAGLVLFSAINAAITISLYQYGIRHYNSVIGQQLILHLVLIGSFIAVAVVQNHENPFRLLLHRPTFLQSLSVGIGGVINSFAILYAPASIVLAANRSAGILWSVLSGRVTFHERHIGLKLAGAGALVCGLALLAIS